MDVSPPDSADPVEFNTLVIDAVVVLSAVIISALKSEDVTGLLPLISVYRPSEKVKIP